MVLLYMYSSLDDMCSPHCHCSPQSLPHPLNTYSVYPYQTAPMITFYMVPTLSASLGGIFSLLYQTVAFWVNYGYILDLPIPIFFMATWGLEATCEILLHGDFEWNNILMYPISSCSVNWQNCNEQLQSNSQPTNVTITGIITKLVQVNTSG